VAQAGDDRHTLWAISDEADLARLAGMFESQPLYVADGHHRYETALNYRKERQAGRPAWTGDEPENFVLLGLTADTDPGLLVLPIHRVVQLHLVKTAEDTCQHAAGAVDGATEERTLRWSDCFPLWRAWTLNLRVRWLCPATTASFW
jgi:uncharacterized protein (DUF1015 family)